MIRSNSDSTTASTASPTPISPFSSYSVTSDPTSDELPDLGAFTTVFRALNHLQPPLRTFPIPIQIPGTQSNASVPISHSEGDSIIAAYLASRSQNQDTEEDLSSDYGSGSGSDTEGEPEGRLVEIEGFSDVDADGQPSLGYLDEALSFIASERARYTAQRDKGVYSDSAWRHVIEPRRKRRRKKSKATPTDTTEGGEDSPSSSSVDLDAPPSSFPFHKSTPGTPGRPKDKRNRRRALRHSKSTPNLDSLLVSPSSVLALDPRVLQLRSLTHKLRLLFPEDSAALSVILARDFPGGSEFVDPRGPVPGPQDTLIHVFIDHSNILIGLLNYLKRYHRNHTINSSSRKPKHMSHAALALILERGRPITRRCVVTSSPLYQPMESAEQLGYEVRVYARVPDLGDGDDRRKSAELGGNSAVSVSSGGSVGKGHWRKNSGGGGGSGSLFKKGHAQKSSGGNTSTESEQGVANIGFPQAFIRSLGSQTTIRPPGSVSGSQQSTAGISITSTGTATNANNPSTNGHTPTAASVPGVRIRYREQGVDELLQLKLHQAIADVDTPPPNATIVLATGDGNVGQFNEDGFLGPVRTALKKGWKVELYAWEEGLSKAWMREFGEGPWKDRFRIIFMETFGADLMEV